MTSDLIVIGICGKARSGKDLCSSALSLHRNCHRIALADPIRSALIDLGGPTADILKGLSPDHNYRRAMKELGTASRDAVNAPGLWVHLALAKIHYASMVFPGRWTRFVIPDIRFRHEEGMLRYQVEQWRGKFGILRLVRTGEPIAESSHASETEVDYVPCHTTYYNEGSIEDLIAAAVEFFDGMMKGHRRETKA